MKKTLFALLILFAFSIIPVASANFIPVTEQAFNIFMFIFVPVLATAFFAVLIAWLIARKRKQKLH
jgi:hypothetical protein